MGEGHSGGECGRESVGRMTSRFDCNGNKEGVEKAIISIGRKEVQEMIDEGKGIEVNCHFCNKNYGFTVDELRDLLAKAR